MVGGVGENVIPKIELRHRQVFLIPASLLELDEDGSRFDIECDEKVITFTSVLTKMWSLNLTKTVMLFLKVALKLKRSNLMDLPIKVTLLFVGSIELMLDSGSSYEPMLALKSYSGLISVKTYLLCVLTVRQNY